MRRHTVNLACDGCGTRRQGNHEQSTADLREQLSTVGWLSDHANDGDLCPTCVARGVSL